MYRGSVKNNGCSGCAGGCGCSGCIISLFNIGGIIKYNKQIKEEERILSKENVDIDNLDGLQFERFIEILYKDLGVKANITPSTADYGADLILDINGKKIAVQVKKRKSQNIGVDAVQEVYASMKYYQVDHAAVITNRYFTKNAKNLAEVNEVKLVDREDLLKIIEKRNNKKETNNKVYLNKKNKYEASQFNFFIKKNVDKALVKLEPYKNKLIKKIKFLKDRIVAELELYKKKIVQASILLKEKTVSKFNCIKYKIDIRYKKYKNKINEIIEKFKTNK